MGPHGVQADIHRMSARRTVPVRIPGGKAKKRKRHQILVAFSFFGVPKGIRTPVTAVKGQCPRPLDDRDFNQNFYFVVEVSGIEPLTSCMPCKRSPS